MASILKLEMDELEETSYHLIAIHTTLEDYHLAFFLNKNLTTQLKKKPNDLQVRFKKQEACYTRFHYDDQQKALQWDLLENKNSTNQTINLNNSDLFSQSEITVSTTNYLLPEFKKVNYFLKITNEENEGNITEWVTKIKKIEKINLVYPIAMDSIKNKNNLIF